MQPKRFFTPKRQQHHGVGLQLGQVDHHVRRDRLAGDIDAAERLADVHLHGFPEGPHFDIEPRQGLRVAALAQQPLEGAHPGAVGDERDGRPSPSTYSTTALRTSGWVVMARSGLAGARKLGLMRTLAPRLDAQRADAVEQPEDRRPQQRGIVIRSFGNIPSPCFAAQPARSSAAVQLDPSAAFPLR